MADMFGRISSNKNFVLNSVKAVRDFMISRAINICVYDKQVVKKDVLAPPCKV